MASIAVLPILIGLAVDYGDPVPGSGPGGARAGRARGPRNARAPREAVAQAAGAGRAHDRHRGAGHGDRVPRPAAVAGADGAGLRSDPGGGDLRRAGLRADRRVGGAGARRSRRRHRRRLACGAPARSSAGDRGSRPSVRGAQSILAARRADDPGAAGSWRRALRRRRRTGAPVAAPVAGRRAGAAGGGGDAASRPRAGAGRRAGGGRVGRRHADRRPVRRHQAGAARTCRRCPTCARWSTSPGSRGRST